MDERDQIPQYRPVKDAHRTLGLWSIRRALTISFGSSIVLLIAAWFFVSWLLGSPAHADPKPLDTATQLELLKLVFALVAGIGALVALVTAYRRQRIDEAAGERAERIQAHAEKTARESQEHAERVAQTAAHDATERRVTDLYGQAVEQLGHDRAAVRLGSLYSLERLAQDHLSHRQTIVNVICAYLRMPFEEDDDLIRRMHGSDTATEEVWSHDASNLLAAASSDTSSLREIRQEIEVRRAAQNVLSRHLKYNEETYWENVRVNLSGATLFDFSLANCKVVDLDCSQATFFGTSWFDETTFQGEANFRDATFQRLARFYGASFEYACFYRVTFGKYAAFSDTTFHQLCAFEACKLLDRSTFERAVFGGEINFADVTFGDTCNIADNIIRDPDLNHSLPPDWTLSPLNSRARIVWMVDGQAQAG